MNNGMQHMPFPLAPRVVRTHVIIPLMRVSSGEVGVKQRSTTREGAAMSIKVAVGASTGSTLPCPENRTQEASILGAAEAQVRMQRMELRISMGTLPMPIEILNPF
jgi:hypothetical protein